MKLLIPGKTFLVGEYAVLLGGTALGLATRPYFEFDFLDPLEKSNPLSDVSDFLNEQSFHPDSPAGLYLSSHPQKLLFRFRDHYQAQNVTGGFGRSTAEYLAAQAQDLIRKKKSFFDILSEYRALHSEKLIKPSGIDLAFQFFGSVTLADQTLGFYQNFDWQFQSVEFLAVATGLKVQTHQHLAELDLKRLENLPDLSNRIATLYSENKPVEFIEALSEWCERLNENHLTHLNSLHLKQHLEKHQEVILVKPCGALGADVVLVFFKPEHRLHIREVLDQLKLKSLAGPDDLAAGFVTQLRHFWSDHVDRSFSTV